MIEIIKKIIKEYFGNVIFCKKSYAQEGEDLVMDRLLNKKKGFYIEVGCHHPFRFSNTYYFYRKGWKGICIDPMPGTKKSFSKWRPRDFSIEMGISNAPSTLEYYMFNEPALNTFDKDIAIERDGLRSYKLISTKEIHTDTLASILEEHCSPKDIDILSVDAEGMDLVVLKSNDWKKFKPTLIVAECLKTKLTDLAQNEVVIYLNTLNYEPYAKTGNSVIFILKDYKFV